MTAFLAVMTYAMLGLVLGAVVIVFVLLLQLGFCLINMMGDLW